MSTDAAPLLDPDLGDPRARACREARLRGDLLPTAAALDAARGAWDRRWFLLSLIDADVPRHLFDQLVAAHPQNPVAYLLRGVHAIQWGWQARGRGWADSVTEEGWRLLKERCDMAVADLRYAASLDPADPTAFGFLLRAGLGAKWTMQEADAAFEEGRRRDPENYDVYRRALQWKCKKWHGSEEAMFAFARAAAQSAPSGSDLHGLVIDAHLEQCFAVESQSFEHSRAYVSQPQVQGEIDYARAKSVGSPQHQARAWSYLVHHDLLRLRYRVSDRRGVQDELRALAGRLDPLYFGVDVASGSALVAKIRAFANDVERQQIEQRQSKREHRSVVAGLVAVALLVGVSLLAAAYQSVAPKVPSHFWIRNSNPMPVMISIDGAPAEAFQAYEAIEYELEPGESYALRVMRGDAAAEVLEEGVFTPPPRRWLGLLGSAAIYDVSGAGRYVSAQVGYDGSRAEVHDLGMDGRVVIFPEEYRTYRTYFPDQQPSGTVLEGVCARAGDGSIPCLR